MALALALIRRLLLIHLQPCNSQVEGTEAIRPWGPEYQPRTQSLIHHINIQIWTNLAELNDVTARSTTQLTQRTNYKDLW